MRPDLGEARPRQLRSDSLGHLCRQPHGPLVISSSLPGGQQPVGHRIGRDGPQCRFTGPGDSGHGLRDSAEHGMQPPAELSDATRQRPVRGGLDEPTVRQDPQGHRLQRRIDRNTVEQPLERLRQQHRRHRVPPHRPQDPLGSLPVEPSREVQLGAQPLVVHHDRGRLDLADDALPVTCSAVVRARTKPGRNSMPPVVHTREIVDAFRRNTDLAC